MKSIKFLFAFLLIYTTNLVAQQPNSGIVTGKIIDNSTKEPMSYSTVKITDGTKSVAVVTTKEDGSFEIKNLELKPLVLQVNYVGYINITKELNLSEGNSQINLGNLALVSDAKSIEAVTIVKERSTIEQKADRKVVTIWKRLNCIWYNCI